VTISVLQENSNGKWTAWLADTLKRLENGKGQMPDVDNLTAIADGIFGKTICPLGDAAAMPVQSFVKKFREEFVSHVENKGCKAGK
jgi:NADH-quinone oxidoreductase subunit F